MKFHRVIFIVCCIVFCQASPDFAETDTLNVGFDQAWYAMIKTLQQDTISINSYDKNNGVIITDYIEMPWSKQQDIAIQRRSYMGKWDRSLAVWEKIRYKFDIKLTPLDSSQIIADITPRIYVYESNTTECMHPYSSSGKLENDLFMKLNSNVYLDQESKFASRTRKHIASQKITTLFENSGISSWTVEKSIPGNPGIVINVIEKILRDYYFSIKSFNKDAGFIATGYQSVPKIIKDRFINEELITPVGGFNKAFSIWEDPYRVSVEVKIAPTVSKDSLRITLKSFYERYESNTTERWHRFKSTGYLENEIMITLQKALKNIDRIDSYPITHVHLDSVKTELIDQPLPVLWFSVLQSLHKKKMKISESLIDSALIIVTDYKKHGNMYCSYSMMVRPVDTNKTRLDFSVSSRSDNPAEDNLSVYYKESPKNIIPEFLRNVKQHLQKFTVLANIDSLVSNDTLFTSENDSSLIQDFIENLDLLKSTDCVPAFETIPEWVKIAADDSGKSLTATLLVKEPFMTYYPLCKSYIMDVIFRQYIIKLTFALGVDFTKLSKIANVNFRFIFKFYNLDDESPIDNKYHDYRIALKTPDINSFVTFESDVQELMRRSSILPVE